MSSIVPSSIFYDVFLVTLVGSVFSLLASLTLHFFVPKAMLTAYFKEPYFSSAEIAFFSGFPFAYMRTAMFMRLAAFPGSGRKRGIPEDVCLLAPAWFRATSKVLLTLFVAFAVPLFILILLPGF